jgi:preprotein translocase subunit SecE
VQAAHRSPRNALSRRELFVARNRKRAKERRSRRPESGPSQPAVAAARVDRDKATPRVDRDEATPGPISHATPDVELAEAQLALGRPELIGAPAQEPDEDEFGEDLADFGGNGPPSGGGGALAGPGDGGALEPSAAAVPEPRGRLGHRLLNFLRGSWRELQRVQWPNRQQVMQATGVVIGFVIVAGAFLGVADLVASKLVTFILK